MHLRTVGTQSITVTDTVTSSTTGSQAAIRVIRSPASPGRRPASATSAHVHARGQRDAGGHGVQLRHRLNGDGTVDQTVSGPSGATVDTPTPPAVPTPWSDGAVHIGTQDYTSNVAHQSVTVFAVSVTIQTDPGNATLKALGRRGQRERRGARAQPGDWQQRRPQHQRHFGRNFSPPPAASLRPSPRVRLRRERTLRLTGGLAVPAFLFGGDGNDTWMPAAAPPITSWWAAPVRCPHWRQRSRSFDRRARVRHAPGGGGDDILIGGYTDYDANLTALCAIMRSGAGPTPITAPT